MPVTVTLSAMPGRLTREHGYTTKTIEHFGRTFGSEVVNAASTVADIKGAVARFGARVRAHHQDTSFYVSVRLAKGCRKPSGYDAASTRNGFGQDDFLHVHDGQAALAAVKATTPVQPLSASASGPEHGYDDSNYPPPCTNPGGHSWVISEETDRCYCQYCSADGDA